MQKENNHHPNRKGFFNITGTARSAVLVVACFIVVSTNSYAAQQLFKYQDKLPALPPATVSIEVPFDQLREKADYSVQLPDGRVLSGTLKRRSKDEYVLPFKGGLGSLRYRRDREGQTEMSAFFQHRL